jgi:hypothetical protein
VKAGEGCCCCWEEEAECGGWAGPAGLKAKGEDAAACEPPLAAAAAVGLMPKAAAVVEPGVGPGQYALTGAAAGNPGQPAPEKAPGGLGVGMGSRPGPENGPAASAAEGQVA